MTPRTEVLLDGLAFIIVDHPKANADVRTLADERRLRVRPHWAGIGASQFVSARFSDSSGSPVLSQFVYQETGVELTVTRSTPGRRARPWAASK